MGKYFITGRQGSGKTTVIQHLQERGFAAFNTDDLSEATKLQNRKTGETIEWPNGKVDWISYAWNWQADYIHKLLTSERDVFLGAVVSNQTDFYHLFDKVFVLIVDVKTLRKHLERHEHASHHLPGEIDRLVGLHIEKQDLFLKEGAIPIEGGRQVDEIVNDILAQCELH